MFTVAIFILVNVAALILIFLVAADEQISVDAQSVGSPRSSAERTAATHADNGAAIRDTASSTQKDADIISRRKLKAKRLNERLKLIATSVNTVGVGILAAATLTPTFSQTPKSQSEIATSLWTGGIAYCLALCAALTVYSLMRSED